MSNFYAEISHLNSEIQLCETELQYYIKANSTTTARVISDSSGVVEISVGEFQYQVYINNKLCEVIYEEPGIMWPYIWNHDMFIEQLKFLDINATDNPTYFISIQRILETPMEVCFEINVNVISCLVDERSPTYQLEPKSFRMVVKRIKKEE